MNGVLKIPKLIVDDFTSSLFLNFVAFEQCYSKCVEKPITEKPKPITENPITDYAIFMCSLINAPSDVGCLCDHKIVENYFGSDDEVARFFTSVGKDVTFDIQRSYLSKVFEEVNEFYWNDWHVTWAGFRHTYFDTPWSFISAMAALLLLILTSVQAFFAAYAYIKPPNSKN
ncbi:hypothetical protein SAY86_001612 [Trapa natans]|uniref:Uncharacterized protein n=1 Tax=Trapa natans TaxID=22666 RepID=A0AAN7R3Z2_TRANT|nr:hypothetical protein SAY86_001612 [Trapa natans]